MKSWPTKNNIRKAQYAGQFYPEDESELELLLHQYFSEAKTRENTDTEKLTPRALIAPHAGYIFSGKVAASAYQRIPKNANFKRVIVIASSHHYSFNGAAVYGAGNYETPLGKVKVDFDFVNNLLNESPLFLQHNETHIYEHSLEVQLPFLQHRLGSNFSLVPIILGTQRLETCQKIAKVLKKWFTPENLFIISTDFSHYVNYNQAIKIDEITSDAICSNKPEQLFQILSENKKLDIPNLATSLCGWTSVLTLLYLTENLPFTFEKIYYQNSGDNLVYLNKNKVVGYWAISVYEKNIEFHISKEEKEEILEKARTSIETYVKTGKRNDIVPAVTDGILLEKSGVFVSIYINEKLRGCIGGFAQDITLNEMIQKMAVSASCDRRFNTVQPDELEDMELEISVLSPLRKIKSTDEIILGKHGIYIRKGLKSGTFLPQVATKTNWSLDQFLGHCSRDKAGLGWDGWKTAELFTYEAEIFRG